jgi:hypothetical protein
LNPPGASGRKTDLGQTTKLTRGGSRATCFAVLHDSFNSLCYGIVREFTEAS